MEDMGLHETIKTIGVNHQYTSLTPDFNDFSNPDDAFSKVPYEKGFQLMMFLESLVGEEGIRGFLRNFLRKYSYKSCDSTDFIQTFSDFFKEKLGKNQFLNIEKKIQWDEWLKKPGFPPIKLAINISDFDDCKALALNFMNNGVSNAELIEKYEKFELDLKIVFLKSIYDGFNNVPKEKLEVLLDVLKLNNEKNKEILFVWLRVCVKNNFIENFVKVEEFLRSTGRMKFVVPLYVELGKVNMLFALEAFERNKKGYHSITSEIIGKKLKK